MKLTALYEGFNLNPRRPTDHAKRNEVLLMIDALSKIINNCLFI